MTGVGQLGMLDLDEAARKLAQRTTGTFVEWRAALSLVGDHVMPQLVEVCIARSFDPGMFLALVAVSEDPTLRGRTHVPVRRHPIEARPRRRKRRH